MRRLKWLRHVTLTATLFMLSSVASGQAVLPSVRLDVPGVSQAASAGAYASAIDQDYNWGDSYPPDVTNGDLNTASASQAASVNLGTIAATASALASATCINSIGSAEFVPQTDTTLNLSADVMGYESDWGEAGTYGSCYAQGRFRVVGNASEPDVTGGQLNAYLHLVATGGFSDDYAYGYLDTTYLGAAAAGSTADAYGDDGGFAVYVVLRNISGPDQEIFDFVPGSGLNNFYVGTEATVIGDIHDVSSYVDVDSNYGLYVANKNSSIWGFSASASYDIQ